MTAYLEQTRFAQYLHMPQSSLDPELAQFVLDVAEDVITEYLERNPFSTETTELLNGINGPTLNLTGFPVIDVTTVKENADGGGLGASPTTLTEGTDFELDYQKGILYRLATVWPEGVQNVEVVYTYGPATVPHRVELVGYQLAERVYLFGQDESQTTGGWSATTVKGAGRLTEDEIHMLDNLKR